LIEEIPQSEINEVIEQFIKELKTLGYSRKKHERWSVVDGNPNKEKEKEKEKIQSSIG